MNREIAITAVCLWIALLPVAAGADDFHWQGAGTGGNTATDPADPTTLWDQPGNWQEAAVPGEWDTAYLPLANPGYVNAASGRSVSSSFFVRSRKFCRSSPGTALPASACQPCPCPWTSCGEWRGGAS